MTPNLRGILAACVTSGLWGILAVVMKIGLNYTDPITIAWFRFSMAAGLLFFYYIIKEPQSFSLLKHFPPALFIASIGLVINYIGYIFGLHYTSPGTAQVIIQTGPVLLAVAGIIIFKERLNIKQIGGLLTATCGLILFYYNQWQSFDSKESYNLGFLWIMIAAFSWTVYAVLQKKLVQKYPPQLLNLFIYGIPALLLTPFAHPADLQNLDFTAWSIMIFLGLNTLVAYGFLAIAFKYTQAYKVGIIITLNPVITLIITYILIYFPSEFITGEQLSLYSALGALLLLSGVILTVIFSQKEK